MTAKPFTTCLCVCVASFLLFVDAGAAPRARGGTWALIVSGISRDRGERAAEDRVVNELRAHLLDRTGVEPNRLVVLVPEDSSCRDSARQSTADNIHDAVEAFAAAPEDRFVFYYIGQANAVAGKLRFNLPGPDVTNEDLAAWLAASKARRQLVILDCPHASIAAKVLCGRSRVIICASTEKQAYATRFGVHFVPALARMESDSNHDGRISLLEAFTATAREIEQWYAQRQLLPTETPCLEDDGDGVPSERPWRYEINGGDGRQAAGWFLAPLAGGNNG